jgi:hypothetical protein
MVEATDFPRFKLLYREIKIGTHGSNGIITAYYSEPVTNKKVCRLKISIDKKGWDGKYFIYHRGV